jgi:hypothetical protein
MAAAHGGGPAGEPGFEIEAAVKLLARSQGLDYVPLPDGSHIALDDAGPAAQAVAASDHLFAPVKLEILARLVHGPEAYRPAEEHLVTIARSLVQTDAPDQDAVIDQVMHQIEGSQPGWEPFSRTMPASLDDEPVPLREEPAGVGPEPAVLREVLALSADAAARVDVAEGLEFVHWLVHDVAATTMVFSPMCEAEGTNVEGKPAVSIATTAVTKDPIAKFRSLIDPREWPLCELQGRFFRSMTQVTPPQPPPPLLTSPDRGWSATFCEEVDFSYGINPTRDSGMRTNLAFVFFEERAGVGARAPLTTVGSTFDFVSSEDGKIQVDRGYLLLEELASIDRRRMTTLKQLHFGDRPDPGAELCSFWSLAQALISLSCPDSHRPIEERP